VLELPRYASAAELRERLRLVLAWAREGMGLA
jgi:septum formation topological specificity factor MinE